MSLILAMFMFALTMSISPGPVNMVIISSGANHGFRKTLPLFQVLPQDLLYYLYSSVLASTP
jgi:threonine/homoserine/homoserine lactone efflux protein